MLDVPLHRCEVALLRAAVGLVPPAQSDINLAVNAVQTLIAGRRQEGWKATLFQNTHAVYHDRPERADTPSRKLHKVLKALKSD